MQLLQVLLLLAGLCACKAFYILEDFDDEVLDGPHDVQFDVFAALSEPFGDNVEDAPYYGYKKCLPTMCCRLTEQCGPPYSCLKDGKHVANMVPCFYPNIQ